MITIYQQPGEYAPAYNNQWILAGSDNVGAPNFKYLVEVQVGYINGSGSSVSQSFFYDISPRPDGYMVHDCMEAVKDFVEHHMLPGTFDIKLCTNSSVTVMFTITESSDTSIFPPPHITSSYTSWNACLLTSQVKLGTYNPYDYVTNPAFIGDAVKVHSIENDPSLPAKITMKHDVFLHFVFRPNIDSIVYNVVPPVGPVTDSYFYSGDTMVDGLIYQINASPQLAVLNGFTVDTGYSIQVQFMDSDANVLASYIYKIEDVCSKYTKYAVYFLNRRGGISHMNFDGQSKTTLERSANKVKQSTNKIKMVSGDPTWDYDSYAHENNVVSTQVSKAISLVSDWLAEDQSGYLEELFDSPLVWLVDLGPKFDRDDKFTPIDNTAVNYEFGKNENGNLFNLKMSFDYSTKETRQRAI